MPGEVQGTLDAVDGARAAVTTRRLPYRLCPPTRIGVSPNHIRSTCLAGRDPPRRMRHAQPLYLTWRIDPMATCADARRYSVLIVDDHRDSADILALLLRLHGHEARVAYNGEQALTAVRDWQPEAAVLDVVMSGLDGIELAARMRQEAARPMLLVALTGLGRDEDLAAVKAGAFDHVFLKPVEHDELLGLLDARLAATPGSVGEAGRASFVKPSRPITGPHAETPVFGSAPSAVTCRKRRAAYAVISREDGRVATACRPRGFWLPGGGILPGERPEDSVKRRSSKNWAGPSG